jgi:hypothetical protein
MEQILLVGPEPQFVNLGSATGSSLRSFVDGKTSATVAKHRQHNDKLSAWCREHRQKRSVAAAARAESFMRLAKAAAK